ncbi:hypothetical protein JCM17380_24900 [Desulfosporosinus burensis]
MFNVTFNGLDIPNYVKVRAVDISALASVSTNIIPKTGGIGGIHTGTTLGAKRIKLKVIIVPENSGELASMVRALGEWLMGNQFKPSELWFSDDPNVYYDAIVNNSVDITDLLFAGEGEIEFIVPSGVARGAIHGNIATVDYGLKTVTVYYNGTAPSSAYIYYHPNYSVVEADDWSMTVQETGDRLKMKQFMSFGNNYIDCEKRRITSTTGTSMQDVLLNFTEWINFPKRGAYTIDWNFNPDCTLEVSCTEYFL